MSTNADNYVPALGYHWLSPAYDAVVRYTTREVRKPGGELHVADWGQAANPLMRALFYVIQLLDGFTNTADNVQGRLPQFMRAAGLVDLDERRRFSTIWGTLSLYRAQRPDSR